VADRIPEGANWTGSGSRIGPTTRDLRARAWPAAYASLSTYRQIAILTPVLAAFLLSGHPLLWAIEGLLLAALFYFDLEPALLLIAFAIPFSFVYKRLGAAVLSPTEVLILAYALAYGVRLMRRPPGGRPGADANGPAPIASPKRRDLNCLDWAVLVFVAVSALSLWAAQDLMAAAWVLRIQVLEPALLYLFVRTYPRRRAVALHLADALVLGAVAVSMIGLYQYFLTAYVEAVEGVRRILSLYDSPNHLALYLVRVLPIALCLAAFGRQVRLRRLHGLAFLPIALCLFLTYSRGAWLLGLPAALLAIAVLRGRRATGLALGLLVLAALALLPFVRTPRLASLVNLSGGTSFNRLVLWQGSLRMLLAHPLWGVGIGNFQSQYPHYMLPEAWREPTLYHPHNIVLEFWTVLGLPGLAALAWLVGAFLLSSIRLYRRLDDPSLQALVLGLIAGMAAALAHSLVDSAYFLTDLALLFMLSLGLVSALNQRDQATPTE
jgi:putative inorganic carbon (HCO3(-)) transporter